MNRSTVLLQTHLSDTPHMATVTQHAQASSLASQTYQLFCTTICKYGTAKTLLHKIYEEKWIYWHAKYSYV